MGQTSQEAAVYAWGMPLQSLVKYHCSQLLCDPTRRGEGEEKGRRRGGEGEEKERRRGGEGEEKERRRRGEGEERRNVMGMQDNK